MSYTRADSVFVHRLAAALQKRGIDVWLDVKDIKVGDSISRSVEGALATVDFACLVLSQRSSQSRWVDREYRAALTLQLERVDQKPIVIPILIDDTPLPPLLKDIRYADFRGEFGRSLEDLCSGLGVPVATAPFVDLLDECAGTAGTSLPACLADLVARQAIEPLCRIWQTLVESAEQLHAELAALDSTGGVLVQPAQLDLFLGAERTQAGLVPVAPVAMQEVLQVSHSGASQYHLSMNGVEELATCLARYPQACKHRAIYPVPESVAWTREWDGDPPKVMDFRQFIQTTLPWRE